jgi:hypothetical protein
MAENDEVVTLLREIRDVQKAHFERYQEFTSLVSKQQEEEMKQVAASRLQTQQQLTEMRQSISRSRLIAWLVLVPFLLLLIFSLGAPILMALLGLLHP